MCIGTSDLPNAVGWVDDALKTPRLNPPTVTQARKPEFWEHSVAGSSAPCNMPGSFLPLLPVHTNPGSHGPNLPT
jgi:hypothetical protein